MPTYTGATSVTPSSSAQTLQTAGKYCFSNITIAAAVVPAPTKTRFIIQFDIDSPTNPQYTNVEVSYANNGYYASTNEYCTSTRHTVHESTYGISATVQWQRQYYTATFSSSAIIIRPWYYNRREGTSWGVSFLDLTTGSYLAVS